MGPFTYSILPKKPKQCFVVEPISYQIGVLEKNVGKDNVKIIQGAITDKKKIEISWDGVSESVPTFSFKEFLDENASVLKVLASEHLKKINYFKNQN
mgnify:CR=1 FL=1